MGVFRVVLLHPAVHREGLVRRTHARQRVAQGEIGVEQRGAIARFGRRPPPASGGTGSLSGASDTSRSATSVARPHSPSRSNPSSANSNSSSPRVSSPPASSRVRQKQVKLRVVGILEDVALQLHDARRSARLDRYQRQVTQRCRWLRLAVPCLDRAPALSGPDPYLDPGSANAMGSPGGETIRSSVAPSGSSSPVVIADSSSASAASPIELQIGGLDPLEVGIGLQPGGLQIELGRLLQAGNGLDPLLDGRRLAQD